MCWREQRPLQPGRGHFQRVAASDWIVHIQQRRDFTTGPCAIFNRDAVFRLVDIHTQQAGTGIRTELDTHEFKTEIGDSRLQKLFEFVDVGESVVFKT